MERFKIEKTYSESCECYLEVTCSNGFKESISSDEFLEIEKLNIIMLMIYNQGFIDGKNS